MQIHKVETGNKAVVFVKFSPDGKHIATAFKDSIVAIWSAKDLSVVSEIPITGPVGGGNAPINDGMNDNAGDRRGRRGQHKRNVAAGWSACTGLDYSKDGTTIAVMCERGMFKHCNLMVHGVIVVWASTR